METAVAGKTMSDNHQTTTKSNEPMVYQIRIQEHLSHQWTEWFAGLSITLEKNGNTLLTGPIADQAALHGLLKKVRDLGMTLLSVNCVEPRPTEKSKIKP
jgi:hypothetical protein